MNRSAMRLAITFVLAACRQPVTPHPTANSPAQTVLVLREMSIRRLATGEVVFRLHGDGRIESPGSTGARLYPDGRIENGGQVIGRLRADGRMESARGPREGDPVIGEDGSIRINGQLQFEIGPDGVLTEGPRRRRDLAVDGPPEGRRAVMLTMLMASGG